MPRSIFACCVSRPFFPDSWTAQAGSVALSALLEFLIRSRIHALLDFADAETLVSSFQHVLRGICDGDILLTSDMTTLFKKLT